MLPNMFFFIRVMVQCGCPTIARFFLQAIMIQVTEMVAEGDHLKVKPCDGMCILQLQKNTQITMFMYHVTMESIDVKFTYVKCIIMFVWKHHFHMVK